MPKINILWEGNLDLSRVIWGDSNHPEFRLNSKFDSEIQIYWLQHNRQHPNDYNGNLLYLYDFQFEKSLLTLITGTIRFSTVMFMANKEIKIDQGLGLMGVQCLIFSQDEEYLLVGNRSMNQSYYPGALTIPGGMLERNDLNNPPRFSLMREIKEEVNLEFQNPVNLIAILSGWNGISITFLLSTITSTIVNPFERISVEDEEWQNGLEWMPINQLTTINQNNFTILDGLQYYKSLI